jgi:hypothetical protein
MPPEKECCPPCHGWLRKYEELKADRMSQVQKHNSVEDKNKSIPARQCKRKQPDLSDCMHRSEQ